MPFKDRRKSEKLEKSPGFVTITVSPDKLRAIFPDSTVSKRGTDTDSVSTPVPASTTPQDDTSSPSATLNAAANDNASESTPSTPSGANNTSNGAGAEGTPGPSQSSMAPPTGAADGAKKKGVKRSAAAAGVDGVDGTGSGGPSSVNGDAVAAPASRRTKPGPKKKAKLYVISPAHSGANCPTSRFSY